MTKKRRKTHTDSNKYIKCPTCGTIVCKKGLTQHNRNTSKHRNVDLYIAHKDSESLNISISAEHINPFIEKNKIYLTEQKKLQTKRKRCMLVVHDIIVLTVIVLTIKTVGHIKVICNIII